MLISKDSLNKNYSLFVIIINKYHIVIEGDQVKQIHVQKLIQDKENILKSSNNFWAGISTLFDENQRKWMQRDR